MKFLSIISLLFALTGNLHAAAEGPADNSFAGKMGRVTGRLKAAIASKDPSEFGSMHGILQSGFNFIARGTDPEVAREPGYRWSISAPGTSVSDRNKDVIAAFFNTAAYALIYLQRFTHSEGKSPLDFYNTFMGDLIQEILGDTPAQITQTQQAGYLLAHALTRFSGNDIEDGAAFKARFRDGYLSSAIGLLARNVQGLTYPKPQFDRKSYLDALGKIKAKNLSVTVYNTARTLDRSVRENFFRLMGLGHKPSIVGFHLGSGFSQSTVNGVVVASSKFSEVSITILLGRERFNISGTREAINEITTAINPRTRRITAAFETMAKDPFVSFAAMSWG